MWKLTTTILLFLLSSQVEMKETSNSTDTTTIENRDDGVRSRLNQVLTCLGVMVIIIIVVVCTTILSHNTKKRFEAYDLEEQQQLQNRVLTMRERVAEITQFQT